MKHIKLFEEMNHRKVYSLSELYPIEVWIKNLWEKLNNLSEEQIENFFMRVENDFGEDVASIINSMASADYLHYHQNGNTTFTGGTDTYPFIVDFDIISEGIDAILVGVS